MRVQIDTFLKKVKRMQDLKATFNFANWLLSWHYQDFISTFTIVQYVKLQRGEVTLKSTCSQE